jgi:hypothetical protein
MKQVIDYAQRSSAPLRMNWWQFAWAVSVILTLATLLCLPLWIVAMVLPRWTG